MLRGDVHRFYQRLRKRWPDPEMAEIPDLNHVRTIYRYYAALDCNERSLLLAWAKKEESGIGLIPMVLSGVPFVTLLFSPMIQQMVRDRPPWVWVSLWAASATLLIVAFYIHHRQRAYTTLHIQLLEQLQKLSGSGECETSVDAAEAEGVGHGQADAAFHAAGGDDVH